MERWLVSLSQTKWCIFGSKRDGNVDRISELPEALILQILSLLPTKEAIATSVLSRQWQSIWKMLPKLKFNYCHHSCGLGTFLKNVCKALLSHEASILQSFHLKVSSNRTNANDIRILIGIALARNVRKLLLEVDSNPTLWVRFHENLYTSETLETLKLVYIGLMEVPSVCMKSLRTLHLYQVHFKDEESVVKLLSGFPILETLMVHNIGLSTVKTFTIAVPSLQRLTIHDYSNECRAGYVINAPSLKYLEIDLGDGYIGFCKTENVTELVEANLRGICLTEYVTVENEPGSITIRPIINEKLVGCLTSVKRLYLQLLDVQIPTGIIFHQLVYLELYTRDIPWRNLLSLMLDTSPKLQVLKLIDLGWESMADCCEWTQPTNVPECLLFHLETFIWKGYKWKREEEIQVAEYILSNANCLKRATFFSKDIDLKERAELVEDFGSVVRASSSCQLLFQVMEYY